MFGGNIKVMLDAILPIGPLLTVADSGKEKDEHISRKLRTQCLK